MLDAAPPSAVSTACQSSQGNPGGKSVKSLSKNTRIAHFMHHDAMSELVAKALWASFPDCASELEIAEQAAPYFRNKNGEPISERTIRYWLRGETLPSALHLSALMMMQPTLFLSNLFGRAA